MKKQHICCKLITTIAVAVALSGCAVPTTGVIPRNESMYTVTRQGSAAWVSLDSLKTAAIQEAAEFCAGTSQRFKLIHSKEIPSGPFGRWPESEILFRCE